MSIYQSGGTANGRRLLTLTSPITLERTGEIICANQADVSEAVSTAREIQPIWSKTSFSRSGYSLLWEIKAGSRYWLELR